MKKVIQCLIIFAIVFVVVFLADTVINKSETKNKTYSKNKEFVNIKDEYKVLNNLYFANDGMELSLYKDKTYILYQKNDIQGGSYKIADNKLYLEQDKKYTNDCYDLVKADYTYLVEMNNKNEIINVVISGNKLSIASLDSLTNIKDILLNKNIACEIKTAKSDETKNEINTTNTITNTKENNSVTVETKEEVEVTTDSNIDINIENTNEVIINGEQVINETTDKNNSNKITYPEKSWTIERKSGFCTQKITEVYRDDKYIYSVPTPCDAEIKITINGQKYTLEEVIKKGIISVDELNSKGLKIYKEEIKNNETKEITWELVKESGICTQKITEVYKDDKYIYNVPTPCDAKANIVYSNGQKYTLEEVIKKGLISIEELNKKGAKITKVEIKENTSCPVGSTLVKDLELGNICVKSYKEAITTNNTYTCHAATYTWNCPNNNSSKIEDTSVGCHADALVSSLNACRNAGCEVKNVFYGEDRHYTEEEMKKTSKTYLLDCKKEKYSETKYYCQSGWDNLPSDDTKCYVKAF